jgi:hypothetical protein
MKSFNENSQSPVSRFEPGTSHIRSGSVNRSTTTDSFFITSRKVLNYTKKTNFSYAKFILFHFRLFITESWSRVSSGSIVSDYGLDDRAIGVRSPEGGGKRFFL